MSQTIRVAISGGGLAGATLLFALLAHSHLEVHIFESASAFKEAGAAVGVSRNAQAALSLIGQPAVECLQRAGAVPQKGVQAMMGQGAGQGSMVCLLDADNVGGSRVTSIVHRAALLRELLASVPADHMHVSKKLESVDRNNDGSLTIHFSDETTHDCDILIGADGIHSTVRKLVLGEGDPAAVPRNTGWWAVMALKPYAEAQASIGKGPINIEDAREYGWIGDGTFLMHNLLSDGQLAQLIVTAYEEEAVGSDQWFRTVSADELRKHYQDWPPHLKKAVEELLCDEPERPAMYLWEHPPCHTYVSGPLCIMGDAAHATTPWQASGGGMSVEDSFILSYLLGNAKTTMEAVNALKAYDEVRRPRTQRIVESSRGTGEIMTGRGGETKVPVEQVREKLVHRWDFIWDIELEKHRDEAITIMDRLNQHTGP
ncbi:hypothetical protein N8I77_005447 [Diaporthe amygdali]|uniref:FAD-binding domain-containing protein n=1 Tax=Phomopsis amygdali TaxID=1214568 RepID=A0AAD9SH70_PHOAM|nr:hypothetical protein N8I77_005447 [Diaporthe amygdali]